ncbi:hypothetical protein HYV89_01760 [Candidatus Woesearchaeota archaeon]|nr:hypothetical protein [Candidatus Woesearchaeota archaeon]
MSKLYLPIEVEGNQTFSIKQYAEMKSLTRQAVYYHIERYLRRSSEPGSSIRNLEVYIEERDEVVYVHNLRENKREGFFMTFSPLSGELRKEIKKSRGQRGPDKMSRRLNQASLLNLLPLRLKNKQVNLKKSS